MASKTEIETLVEKLEDLEETVERLEEKVERRKTAKSASRYLHRDEKGRHRLSYAQVARDEGFSVGSNKQN